MAEQPKAEVIIVHETVLKSWCRDASVFALFISLIGIGILAESSAMQWVGAFIAFVAIAIRASGKTKRMSIAEARAKLDAIERGEHD